MDIYATIFTGICTLFAAVIVFVITHSDDTERRHWQQISESCSRSGLLVSRARIAVTEIADRVIRAIESLDEVPDETNLLSGMSEVYHQLHEARLVCYANSVDGDLAIHDTVMQQCISIETSLSAILIHDREYRWSERQYAAVAQMDPEELSNSIYEHPSKLLKQMSKIERENQQRETGVKELVQDLNSLTAILCARMANIQRSSSLAVTRPWWERLVSQNRSEICNLQRTGWDSETLELMKKQEMRSDTE